jgi:GNAT superfamily N-acetyltransferase
MTIRVNVVTDNDPRVVAFLGTMPSNSRLEIFGGVRWHQVEVIAVAVDDTGLVVGMASLAPGGEYGEMTPKILGVWVRPHSRMQGIGTLLVKQLAEESLSRYHAQALVTPYTEPGLALCLRVAALEAVSLTVRTDSNKHDLS